VEQAGKNGRLWVVIDQGRYKNQGSRETSREEGRVVIDQGRGQNLGSRKTSRKEGQVAGSK
jgi:hypothetical protein